MSMCNFLKGGSRGGGANFLSQVTNNRHEQTECSYIRGSSDRTIQEGSSLRGEMLGGKVVTARSTKEYLDYVLSHMT